MRAKLHHAPGWPAGNVVLPRLRAPLAEAEAMTAQRMPLRAIWRIRYRAYRTKYRPAKAFWRGVVIGELAVKGPLKGWAFRRIKDDEFSLLDRLVIVEIVGVEFHP